MRYPRTKARGKSTEINLLMHTFSVLKLNDLVKIGRKVMKQMQVDEWEFTIFGKDRCETLDLSDLNSDNVVVKYLIACMYCTCVLGKKLTCLKSCHCLCSIESTAFKPNYRFDQGTGEMESG